MTPRLRLEYYQRGYFIYLQMMLNDVRIALLFAAFISSVKRNEAMDSTVDVRDAVSLPSLIVGRSVAVPLSHSDALLGVAHPVGDCI